MTTSTESWHATTVKAGSHRTRVLLAGSENDDPVLLLHDGAWGGSATSSWSALTPLLATRYRVIAPDLIGFGESSKAVVLDEAPVESRIDHVTDILAALDERRPVHAVGCSFGGALGLRAIVRDTAPFALRTVTSICGAGGASARTELALRELGSWDGTRADLARILALLIDEDAPDFERHLDERFYCATRPGHYRAVMAASLPLPEPLKTSVSDPWPEQLRGTTIPLHLIRGNRDTLLTEDWAVQIAHVRPDATITEIDGKHAPQIDRASEVAVAVTSFFDKH